MKGVILAGGNATRLRPSSNGISKHLLPIFDKPMIFYPLSILLLSKIREILIVCKQIDYDPYFSLLGDGEKFGVKIHYEFQNSPKGIADGLMIAKKKFGNCNLTLILGDNFLFGDNISSLITRSIGKNKIFLYKVNNPNSYGVAKFDINNQLSNIIEKPKIAPSNYAVIGLYIYNKNSLKYLSKLKRSKRNEFEITSFNKLLLKKNILKFEKFGRGIWWNDLGNPENILEASTFVKSIQSRQNILIGSPEEIAFNNKYISKKTLDKIIKKENSLYYNKLKEIFNL